MILWTIQHRTAYEEMLRTGVLRANPAHIFDECFRESYEWMTEQMKKRIGDSPDGVVLNDGELIFPYDENAVYSKEERQESWENIFDYECTFDDGERTIGLSTQATMWEIKAEWVLKAEHFETR